MKDLCHLVAIWKWMIRQICRLKNLSGRCFKSLSVEDSTEEREDVEELELEDLVYDGLEHLAGFICKKTKEPSSSLASSNSSSSWITHLNEGGLTQPSPEFMSQIE
ncbi:hypothetical protein ABEB36_009161 [Hypothenemus hampei]|uniref:Uncharacterized protein n=1 Tax=Hypothenemus hampei TaxID=57062 RepID=A0ABD1EPD2_HYPHA